MKKLGVQFCVLLLMLLYGAQVYGQADRATITGTVTDSAGAIVPGLRVVATNTGAGASFAAVTNEAGIYLIQNLPIGPYVLEASSPGFKAYKQTGISLIASQVLQVNIHLTVGAATETVTVTGAPIKETETSSVAMTMEETAIRELPLNASGGRDATFLLLQTTPNVGEGASWSASGTQNWVSIAGGMTMSNSIFVDGVDATAGNQGSNFTPGQDALQEMQMQTNITDAELGQTGGGALTYVLKSGTNSFHGSGFEFLQNEDLNANGWASNQFLSQCAAGDASCRANYSRQKFRFNDYGGSAGGPIWKNHTFVFGDFEYYKQSDWRENPAGTTVPTAQMLSGDFSQLLTGGTNQGTILNSNGTPWVNPCTGEPYQYGQIFDPTTSKTVNGVECASPFEGNVIPSGRLSAVSQKVAAIYSQYYKPTIDRIVGGNFPSLSSGSPEYTKKMFDIKVDHYFSERHHLSGSYDWVDTNTLNVYGPFYWATGPFASTWKFLTPGNKMVRAVDNYTFSPTLVNTFSAGWNYSPSTQGPANNIDTGTYGLTAGATAFPQLQFNGTVNGVGFSWVGTSWDLYMNYHAFHYSDTLAWQKSRHSIKFGVQWTAQQLNAATYTRAEQTYTFQSDTGGPTDPNLTPWVGSPMANFMLGDVNYANLQPKNTYYPRQKTLALFTQDDVKVSPKLTLNLGLRWESTLPGHMQNGKWENFDLTTTNPNWAPYTGAWVFSNGSGTTFENNLQWTQFGPHVGVAYQLTSKMVARGSYGLFYVPLGAFSSGGADYYPANQDPLAVGLNEVRTDVVGGTAFNWDGGYPGTTVMPAQDSTATTFGDSNRPMYILPDMLHLGHTQNMYAGIQYEVAKNVLLDVRYFGNRGGNLHDYGRSTDQSYPAWSQYQPLLASGNVNAYINNAADATALGVPYPYPGFTGPAYAAISPYPQIARNGFTVESVGDPRYNSVSAYNSFVAEVKVRNTHGLYIDWNYTLSKQTSSQNGLNNFSNNWGSMFQSPDDSKGASGWITSNDQRQLAKGYVTYDLPFGTNRRWLNQSKLLNYAVGGWSLGYYGSYGSGLPFGSIRSTYQLPYYYSGGGQRASFSNGANARNMKNLFHGNHPNLLNLEAASNNDFNPNAFISTTQAAPFGDTPHAFNNWRWRGSSNENLSAMKHFGFGPDGRYQASIRAEFYDVFNRHYLNTPDTGLGNKTFGQVTGVSGNRVGQLGARFEW